jgi:alkanesulfonate monooxygenase SsuD/methylene tetrahydromethanopterin reductase-like flavin-dependent oxidoreductase (luciferase family)
VTTLATVAALSDRLAVQTVVMNSAWLHPGLLLRHFTQLAVLAGGERVTAGLGAGWSVEEFDALGLAMPRFRARMGRLEEVLRLARALYDTGAASLDGSQVVARDLPLSPLPQRPPRLLVGGGSDRVLEMAGRYADVLDLHGDPRRGRVAGATMAEARAGDVKRRALTTVEDLAGRIGLVRAAAVAAGRPPVAVSTQIWYVAFASSAAAVRAAEEELCAQWAQLPYRRLDRSPYLLLGSPTQMAEALLERRQAYGLERISLSGEPGIRSAPADPVRFWLPSVSTSLPEPGSRLGRGGSGK